MSKAQEAKDYAQEQQHVTDAEPDKAVPEVVGEQE
jgi:hypothetical protein